MITPPLNFESIPEKRKVMLDQIKQILIDCNYHADLLFICTHNSRRSHFAQVWAQASAAYFKRSDIHCYSGGTEVTRLHQNVIEALETSGFNIPALAGENPHFQIDYDKAHPPVIGFSKLFNDAINPQKGFIAIMTCSDADEACPNVSGTEHRFSLPYIDPKVADGTIHERAIYYERSLEIACEMAYLMH